MAMNNTPKKAKMKYKNLWRSDLLEKIVYECRIGGFVQPGNEEGTTLCKACNKKTDFSILTEFKLKLFELLHKLKRGQQQKQFCALNGID